MRGGVDDDSDAVIEYTCNMNSEFQNIEFQPSMIYHSEEFN